MAYENLIRLAEVMDRLRSPGGCPWDAEQTHESLLKYLLEESYEFIESIESGNRQDIQEELGDILLQVYFHARIAQEHQSHPFNVDDVAKSVADKLISRHPHVFSDVKVESTGDVLENWERIKKAEKGRTSAHDGVPTGQPALPVNASKLSMLPLLSLVHKQLAFCGSIVSAYDSSEIEDWPEKLHVPPAPEFNAASQHVIIPPDCVLSHTMFTQYKRVPAVRGVDS